MDDKLYSTKGASQEEREMGLKSSLGSTPSHVPGVLLSLVLGQRAFP